VDKNNGVKIRIRLLALVYLIVGVAIAGSHHYFTNLHTVRQFLSAILAVVLWPLILLGINLHIRR
jgi:uncharacterized membrane protein YoaK (UPF0700 family)